MFKETKKERMSRKASNLWFKKEMLRRKYGNPKKWNDYKSYLLSKEWKRKRNKKIKSVQNKCENCGANKKLQVHHLTYKRIFNEKMEDLIVLCSVCHMEKHGLLTDDMIEKLVTKLLEQ